MLWLPAALASTVGVGTAYVIGQQVLRTGANDPQIQLAQDAAARLSADATPTQVSDGSEADLASSVIVLDQRGAVLASTARLDGATPIPPSGALRATDGGHTNTVTWQPRPGIRQAAVIVGFTGPRGSGTVVVSRSLRLVEQRENTLLTLSLAGWGLALLVAALAAGTASRYWTSRGGPGASRRAWAMA